MANRTLIRNVDIVNEGLSRHGSILIGNDRIEEIFHGDAPDIGDAKVIDCQGAKALPGIIDEHVHFREPGMTQKADIGSESRAAAYGGVTSFFDMPNTVPQTTTIDALRQKLDIAARTSHVNYAFFFGATNSNAAQTRKLDRHRVPGIKLFMGASTGNMLVDRKDALEQIFRDAELPVMTHCEDSVIISHNMKAAKERYGDDPDISLHPWSSRGGTARGCMWPISPRHAKQNSLRQNIPASPPRPSSHTSCSPMPTTSGSARQSSATLR